jgi:hypothetical protein
MKCEMEWVPCVERLPEPGVPVITAIYGSDLIAPLPGESLAEAVDRIFSAPGYTSISFIGEDGLWCDGFFGGPEIVAPSYWMEFPAPPPNPHVEKRKENVLRPGGPNKS